jgi:hypothetical protein
VALQLRSHWPNTAGRYSLRQGHHLTEAIDYFPQFVFSTALAVELLVSRTPDRDDLMPRIRALREEIGVRFDLLPKGEVVKPVALATAASRSAVLQPRPKLSRSS